MRARFLVVAVFLAAAVAPSADARQIVRSEAAFQKAVEAKRWSGGVIVLTRGRYDKLLVGPRSGRWLTIRSRPGATVRYLGIYRAQRVRVIGVRVRPRGRPAVLSVTGSRQVTLVRVGIRGAGLSARVRFRRSEGVTIRDSRFSRCGELVTCVLLGGSSRVRILRSSFRDCYGCDFVRGRVGQGLVVRDSSFQRAVPGECGTAWECNHQDAIQIQGGRGILVERNRFGLVYGGAAQVYVSQNVDGLTIRDNVLLGTDPAHPELAGWAGIIVGNHKPETIIPRNVRIVGNTILTGSPRPDGLANSIFLSPSYADLLVEERPVVANNVIGLLLNPERLCPLLGVSSRNVVRDGPACSDQDASADPGLDETGYPLEGAIVIDQADPAWATRLDVRGWARGDPPDIGAFEYVP